MPCKLVDNKVTVQSNVLPEEGGTCSLRDIYTYIPNYRAPLNQKMEISILRIIF
jgi:hypothetical protein